MRGRTKRRTEGSRVLGIEASWIVEFVRGVAEKWKLLAATAHRRPQTGNETQTQVKSGKREREFVDAYFGGILHYKQVLRETGSPTMFFTHLQLTPAAVAIKGFDPNEFQGVPSEALEAVLRH